MTAAAVLDFGGSSPEADFSCREVSVCFADTVVYPTGGYKLRRTGELPPESIPDSLLQVFADSAEAAEDILDTIPHLTARDTIKAPDSLRFTDPFRYRFYVALVDSLTHVQVRDSLKHSSDSLKDSALVLFEEGDSLAAERDSLHARLDSLDFTKLDSLYAADSSALAREKFLAWYNSLDRKERRAYDLERLGELKQAEMDSLKKVKEEQKAIKDSIIQYTPRILDTYAIPDSMQYKRIISWAVDQDFHQIEPEVPDTSYNYHFYDDYPWRRKDVGASSLGVNGSPVQYYNWFLRSTNTDVTFYEPYECWSVSPSTIRQYNSKTPHTELAYYGTLLSKEEKESDNLHIFTTQNITPELNFSLCYDRFGGGGMLDNETTINKTAYAATNYLGKKYMMNSGFIYNMVSHQENGGMCDNFWVRDTTVDAREIKVNLTDAVSKFKKKTLFLDQQLRIPFNFINELRARRDTTFVPDSSSTDITTAFIGHSTEFTTYARKYTDKISTTDGKEFYGNIFNYNPTCAADSMRVAVFDNKVYLRLQPWAEDGIISKLDVGIGDTYKTYFAPSATDTSTVRQNSLYVYAGARGQYDNLLKWDAHGSYTILGYNLADFSLSANAALDFYPFRRSRKSPLSVKGHFETSLKEPSYYQNHVWTNHFGWDNSFSKISTTKIGGEIDIPHWKLNAGVNYALLDRNIYYDTLGIARQNMKPMSVLSAYARKEFVTGGFHFDNRVLAQFSSNEEVLPLPTLAVNLKYYFQFVVQKDETKKYNVMVMQIGADALWNTKWYAPGWNPNLGVFHNQTELLYNNGPVFDAFVNIQWKKACIFVKFENAGMGWPMDKADYFTANHYMGTQRAVRFGIFWPFYIQAVRNDSIKI